MKNRVVLALSISILFVGGAVFMRLEKPTGITPTLIESERSSNLDKSSVDDLSLLENDLRNTASTTSLSNTQVLGRRLILDYVDLATNGNANSETIMALAEKYVEIIPELSQIQRISLHEVRTVPNSRENFQKYSDDLIKAYNEHEAVVEKAYANSENLEVLGPSLYSLAETVSASYAETATKLKNFSVPTSLAQVHMGLVNSFLASASAMKAVAETEKDPASALAGLTILNNKTIETKALLKEIDRVLTINGI